MRLLRDTIPLLVDHDPAQRIGEVHSLVVWRWVDQRWIVARCTVDAPPDWLRKGTRAGFSYRVLRSYEFNDWTIVSGALVDEVTILSPAHRPVEPSTEVLLLDRTPAAMSPVGEVSYGDGTVIRRPIGKVLAVR